LAKKSQKPAEKPASKFSPTIKNKKARFNYQLLEKFEAGIVLVGTEVKSLRQGKVSLEEAYARIDGGELYLLGCAIMPYEHGNLMNHDPLRKRKLLVHRRELRKIEGKLSQKGLTLVPMRIYFTRGLAKIEIALATGKTQADKREKIKTRETNRDINRQLKQYNR
jgi:SsrA-binding protein